MMQPIRFYHFRRLLAAGLLAPVGLAGRAEQYACEFLDRLFILTVNRAAETVDIRKAI